MKTLFSPQSNYTPKKSDCDCILEENTGVMYKIIPNDNNIGKKKSRGAMNMKVSEIMTMDVTCVSPDTNVVEVARLMSEEDIGSVPVCEKSRLVGILTDRDIIIRNVAKGKSPETTMVRDIMTADVKTVSPETDIEDLTELMSDSQIRRVPVIENNRIVGIVALSDVALENEFVFEASEALTDISVPGTSDK